MILFDAFIYSKNKKSQNGKYIYLTCALKHSRHCKGTAKIVLDEDHALKGAAHNHDPEAYEYDKFSFLRDLRNEVCNLQDTRSLRRAFDDAAASNSSVGGRVTFKQIESSLYKNRRAQQPNIPSCHEEVVESLRQNSTYGQNFAASVEVGEDKAVMFLSDGMKEHLSEVKEIAFDATFFATPRPYKQYFIVHGVFKGNVLPILHVLMTKKSFELYKGVLAKLKTIAPAFKPVAGMSDFEKASRKAFLEAFPDMKLSGCQFHYAKSIYAKIQKVGLTNVYASNKDFKRWGRMLMSIPFLPEDQIEPAFQQLKQQALGLVEAAEEKTMVKQLLKYWQNFWLLQVGPSNLTVFGLDRSTNNDCESLHSRLNRECKVNHPSFWHFCVQMNKTSKRAELDITRTNNGLTTLNRPRKIVSKRNMERRRLYFGKLGDETYTPMQFLSAMSHTVTSFKKRHVDFDLELDEENIDIEPQEEEEEEEEVADNPMNCKVCFQVKDVRFILIPCGHSYYCDYCVERIGSTCSICRAEFTMKHRIFF